VLIMKRPHDYLATCPALARCVAVAPSRATAYKDIKRRIRSRLSEIVARGMTIPVDPIAAIKHLRLDLTPIREEVDLR
jgi:hypothetical protein